MTISAEYRSRELVVEALESLRREMVLHDDRKHSEKIAQLIGKLESRQVTVALCGHFSAGKSSLINRLCGARLLPSSPIPTSANVVAIRYGIDPQATIHRNDAAAGGSSEGYAGTVSTVAIEELERYCVDGSEVESVEIRYPAPLLENDLSLLDTPGIDSTDEAHYLATQSALHLADVVLYVMDYNHVQSEVNFAFTKLLQDWGKPLYLIVNQIDKHKERELPFSAYKQGVEQAFRDWQINPVGILYLSLKQQNHPENEWSKLLWLLEQLKLEKEQFRQISIMQSAIHLAGEYLRTLEAANDPEKTALRDIAAGKDRTSDMETLKALRESAAALEHEAEQLLSKGKKDIEGIIQNANITPAKTRDLIHAYLESRRPDFKVGFLFGKSKTAAEIDRRSEVCYLDIREQVNVHLEFHLRDSLKKLAEAYGITGEHCLAKIDALSSGVSRDWLEKQVHTGAVFTNEYTMTYSATIASEIKSASRKAAFAILEDLSREVERLSKQKAEVLEKEIKEMEGRLEAELRLEAIEREEKAYEASVLAILDILKSGAQSLQLPELEKAPMREEQAGNPKWEDGHSDSDFRDNGGKRAATGERGNLSGMEPSYAKTDPDRTGSPSPSGLTDQFSANLRSGLSRLAERLHRAADGIGDLPFMASAAGVLRDKARRIESNAFTVALFGAFSAGKSSFANALMGAHALPVSPNPTTAAINKLVPPADDWPHGTAKIKIKSKELMLEDIFHSLGAIGMEPDSAIGEPELLRLIGSLEPERVPAKGRPHYAFLKAVERGWKDTEGRWGEAFRADLDLFRKYAAEEAKSCFVEWIELHYSCPLTEQGIILVDTPGADSINARHTGVAFNYIKNADAILFVTYYNHAFSQADREFLLQLGRVKDSFQMDKMFFIVNASDLASSPEELESVVRHVESNLLQYGIRNPKIYPLSSMLSLEGKTGGNKKLVQDSGILQFETDFIRFAFEDLAGLAAVSANNELDRTIRLMESWLERSQKSAADKKREAEGLKEAYAGIAARLGRPEAEREEQKLAQEMEELLYYVKQRIFFRFGEFYNLAFNPASLNDDSDKKTRLRAAWHELIQLVSYDLSQEILATTLRIEQFLNGMTERWYDSVSREISRAISGYPARIYEAAAFETPQVGDRLDGAEMDEKHILGIYKNAKSFFEGTGKQKLKEALEGQVLEQVNRFVEQQTAVLRSAYLNQYREHISRLTRQIGSSVKDHVEGLLSALETNSDVSGMQRKLDNLKRLADEE
ncbi:dynamin family protein [Ferviditalea candida]|uniref:Dynamin family protein n=1 Tax=Ferviditalea candida TaxID=3108399 RepID=A0ABU5ZFR6_9BACL|nr:dynamin family protein [Paenibacillaceae bacterium T2]